MEFRDKLLCARVNRGYTQAHLANLLGYGQSYIARLENGYPPPMEFLDKAKEILPEIVGGEAPEGVIKMLSMKLNEENKPTDWEEKAAEAFQNPTANLYPVETSVGEFARAIVERDVYKSLYENLLEKVMSK